MYYDYSCKECGSFSLKRSIHDPSETVCPNCGLGVRQIFSVPAVIWKGRFRFWKGNPEVDMDKIDAYQNKQDRKQALAKIEDGMKETSQKYF